MNPGSRNPVLLRANLTSIRPTQCSVGYAEVALKASEWTRLKKKRRREVIDSHVFPGVLGIDRQYYIVDHHHLGLALLEHDVKEIWVAQLDDLSWLEARTFWRTLEFRSWAHPYDQRGRRIDYIDMPTKLTQLKDDPYRSLAGAVRRAGGCAKDSAPFAEFLWADYFRQQLPFKTVNRGPKAVLSQALKLARTDAARYLPGWTGKIRPGKGS